MGLTLVDSSWDSRGQRVRVDHGNGTVTTSTYDPKTFRLALLQTTRGAAVLQKLRYTYDPVGNILELNHRYGASAWTRHYGYTPGTNLTCPPKTGPC